LSNLLIKGRVIAPSVELRW